MQEHTTQTITDTMRKMIPRSDMPDGIALPFMSKFMTIRVNDQYQRVEMHLRGEFDSPFVNTNEITELHELASKYTTLMIFINSPGGRVDTFLELYNIAKMFDHIITVACSEVCSAGFMLWSIGDLRVVQRHTEIMAHRETYGFGGKTDQHMDMHAHAQRRFERISDEIVNGILTADEIEKIRYTEVWLSDEDMIERGVAISWEDFLERDREIVTQDYVVTIQGQTFLVTGPSQLLPVKMTALSEETATLFDIVYQREFLDNTSEELLLEEGEVVVDPADYLKEHPEDIGAYAFDAGLGEKKLREELKEIFGQGNVTIRRNGDIEIVTEGGVGVKGGNFKTGVGPATEGE